MNIREVNETIEPIRVIVRNLRKDGPNRKRTEERAILKLEYLNELWEGFTAVVRQFKPVATTLEIAELECFISEAEKLKQEAEKRILSSIITHESESAREPNIVVSSNVSRSVESAENLSELPGSVKQVKSNEKLIKLGSDSKGVENNENLGNLRNEKENTVRNRENESNDIDNNSDKKNLKSCETVYESNESAEDMASFDFNIAQKLPSFSAQSEEKRDEELRDFLSSVEFYHDTLKTDQQPTFVKFLLKCKIQGKAITELGNEAPTKFSELAAILKSKCGSRDTINSLQSRLYSLKQGRKSIKEFTCELESLINKLTDLEVKEQGEEARTILQKSNEAKGFLFLKNNVNEKYKLILECSRHKKLQEAIEHLLEVEATTQEAVYSFRSDTNRNNFHSREQHQNHNNFRQGNNYVRRNSHQNRQGNQNWQNFGYQYRQNFNINSNKQNFQPNKNRQNFNNNPNKHYFQVNQGRQDSYNSYGRRGDAKHQNQQGRQQIRNSGRVFTFAEEENLEDLEGVTDESRDNK